MTKLINDLLRICKNGLKEPQKQSNIKEIKPIFLNFKFLKSKLIPKSGTYITQRKNTHELKYNVIKLIEFHDLFIRKI